MKSSEMKKPTRSRAANKLFRRQQLIDATIDCIDELGFADTTLAKVAQRAGLSQGIVIFHFKSKEALFDETLRYMTEEYKTTWQTAFEKSPPTPIDRLCTLVKSDFDPTICNQTKVGIWQAFWGEAKSRPKYKDLYNAVDKELTDALLVECNKLSESPTAKMSGYSALLAIEGIVNGLWHRCLMTPQNFNRKESLDATLDVIAAIYPDHQDDVEIYKRKLK